MADGTRTPRGETTESRENSLDELTCPVCFELYNEPTALPCGHSFCLVCIETSWESKGEDTGCVCPNCREVFPQKPKLKKNVTIANLVDKIKMKKREVGTYPFVMVWSWNIPHKHEISANEHLLRIIYHVLLFVIHLSKP
uniref:RING-type domain-containing protein n=1 Tax=Eptatretus burgeri TaxID=7764 RepID=A0A8C4Q4N3_EPTBU